MADTFTSLLRLVLQETGGNQNVWGDINNASAIDLLEDAIAARLSLDVTPAGTDKILTTSNGSDDQARNSVIALTGVPGEAKNIIVPSTAKLYIISNETADVMTIKTVANAGVAVRANSRVAVMVDPVADDVFEIGFIPTASETETGLIQIADQAEVDAGTDDTKAITPLKYESSSQIAQATDSTLGRVELATQVEVDAGTDSDRVITPETYEARKSSLTLSGHIELATQAEVDTGTDTERAVTPATLAGIPSSSAVIFSGFVPANGIGEVVPAGWSATRTGLGLYNVTHNLALSDVDDLIITLTGIGTVDGPGGMIIAVLRNRFASSFTLQLGNPDMGVGGGGGNVDRDFMFIAQDNS
jgi:hypothetical protein